MGYSFNKDNTVSLRAVSIFWFETDFVYRQRTLLLTFLCNLKMGFPFYFFGFLVHQRTSSRLWLPLVYIMQCLFSLSVIKFKVKKNVQWCLCIAEPLWSEEISGDCLVQQRSHWLRAAKSISIIIVIIFWFLCVCLSNQNWRQYYIKKTW